MKFNFKIKSDAEYFESFFKKDKEGKELFSPWGYGEAYFVNAAQKKNIILWMRIFLWLTLLSLPLLFLWGARFYAGTFGPCWIMVVLVSVFIIGAILMNRSFTRDLELSSENFRKIEDLKIRTRHKALFIYASIVLILGWLSNPYDLGTTLALLILLIILPISLSIFKKRNGYIFRKNPSENFTGTSD